MSVFICSPPQEMKSISKDLGPQIISVCSLSLPAIFSNSHRYNVEITDGNRLIFLGNERFDFIWSNFWLNKKEYNGNIVANSGFGNKCKVEVISRSDLLRARGFKV